MTQIVSVFGATGSIGRSTADLLAQHADRFRAGALVGGKDPVALAQMARALNAGYAALADASAGPALAEALSGSRHPQRGGGRGRHGGGRPGRRHRGGGGERGSRV